MQPCVSVIIPVYNIEKHLEKCLDSVIGQTLKNIEIIVVDDGSTDNSPRIIDRYARTDSRIVAIHKANEGLAYARKSGIEAAHGKYVQHLDGDDFLEPDACELLFNRAEETNADKKNRHFGHKTNTIISRLSIRWHTKTTVGI